MFSAFEWMVAGRYLRARRREGFISVITWFSLIGIALGVATLIIVLSVFNGFRHELLTRILGVNGHVTVFGASAGITDYEEWAARLGAVPGVVAVHPMIEGQVMTTANRVSRGAVVRGLEAADLRTRPLLAEKLIAGNLTALDGAESVLIGARMAEAMGLKVGDQITLIAPKGTVTAFGTVPRVRPYRIAGIFEMGMVQYDGGFVFMPLPAAQTFFQVPQAVTTLEVFVDDPERAPRLAPAIAAAAPEAARVFDWKRANAAYFRAVEVQRNVLFLILLLIVLVAAFNIVSSLIMLVNDKNRGIAVLRTMGASRGSIMRIFFLAGAGIGLAGTAAGFVLGLVFCANIEAVRRALQALTGTDLFAPEIYFLSELPARVDPWDVLTVVAVALALAFVATVYPSWRAARIDPAEALRYE